MTTVQNTYTLNKIKQLVDLNGDTTNFDITFKVNSKNGEPFDIVVVDQTTLDNSPELQYKNASKGIMSGNLIQDKNVYQNYFLVLKADQPCEVDVEITKKEIPGESPVFTEPQPQVKQPKSGGGINWKMWLLIIVVIGGGVALFFMYKTDKKKKTATMNVEPSGFPSPSPESRPDIASPHHSSPSPSVGDQGNDLMRRLKTLHM